MLAPDLDRLPAVWVSPGLLLVPRAPSGATAWMLHAAAEGGIDVRRREPVPWTQVPLAPLPDGVPMAVREAYPHVSDALALTVPDGLDLQAAVRGQILLIGRADS
ncbi:MAG: hypothetical protein WAW78_01575, partial [Propioniciclava sp.]